MAKISFKKKISSHPVLLDGSMGSLLAQRGLRAGDCPEEWNRSHPRVVADIHRAYVKAGAQVVTTNSLGANRIALRRYGLSNQVVQLNRRAARIAQEACPPKVYVAGSVGPTGAFPQPLGHLTFDELRAIFREQIAALVEGGVDLICVESMSDLHEARAAVTAAQEFPRVPTLATMAFTPGPQGFRTTLGVDPQSAVLELTACAVDALGCSSGQLTLRQMAHLVRELRALTPLPLVAQPTAGKPRLAQGNTLYSRTPRQMAQGADLIIQAGAYIVGGSWGTTPEHIAAMAKTLHLAQRTKKEKGL
jgi:5-methyltetrahydrofolate--homocysteine methyltransferase